MRKTLLQAGTAIGLMVVSAPAMAAADSQGTSSLELELRGRIPARCSLELGNSTVSVTPEQKSGTATLPVVVDCNHNLTVEMRSLRGAMRHTSLAPGQGYAGFASELPYRATLTVNASGAAPVSAESTAMVSGVVGTIGVTPFRAEGELQVKWVAAQVLLAGSYSDVIEIKVSGDM